MTATTHGAVVGHIAVVVPARDEELRIARCLDSIVAAVDALSALRRGHRPSVSITLVADACVDATASIARSYPGVTVLELDAANVGLARRVGVESALEAAPVGPDEVWVANTDADSVVPGSWLLDQLERTHSGADMVIGTVRPDLAELSTERADAWRATRSDTPNGHVHGANLGIRASAYLRAGGFTALPEHEDVDLVARCVALGFTAVASNAGEVETSGRLDGRTPGGYAEYLRTDLLERAGRMRPAETIG